MESQFLRFTQFAPTSLEPRFTRLKADRIDAFYTQRRGDFVFTAIEIGSSTYEVSESFEEVERAVLHAEVRGSA